MNFNLGNFGGRLSIDDVNSAMRNAGSSEQFVAPQAGGIQTPPPPMPSPQPPPPSWEQPQQEQKQGGLGSILGLVGSFMGGTYGAALQGVGGMMGKK